MDKPKHTEQTWTDEELQQHLDQWSALTVDEQNKLEITFNQTAGYLPLVQWRYTLTYEKVAIALTFEQAIAVEAWLQEQYKLHASEILRKKTEELISNSVDFQPKPVVVPRPKHDGMLSTHQYHPHHVELSRTSIEIRDTSYEFVELDAQEALSLLAWLYQERETLEQLAKEQT